MVAGGGELWMGEAWGDGSEGGFGCARSEELFLGLHIN